MSDMIDESYPTKILRYCVTSLYFGLLVVTLTIHGFAGAGAGPFTASTGDVSELFEICVRPEDYTYAIWGLIYFYLLCLAIYASSLLFRKIHYVEAYNYAGAVSIKFLASMLITLCFNIGWSFAWNNELVIISSILAIFVITTNSFALYFGLFSFMKGSIDLLRISKADFWINVVLLNCQCINLTWTVIEGLVNVGVSFGYYGEPVSSFPNLESVCITILSFLLVSFIVYFVIEQFFLKTLASCLVTHYPVYLWATVGSYVKNGDSTNVEVVALLVANVVSAALMTIFRIAIVWKRTNSYEKLL